MNGLENMAPAHTHEFVSVMRGAGVDISECRGCDARRVDLAAGFGVPNVLVFTGLVRAAHVRDGAPADAVPRRSSWWRWLSRWDRA